MKTILTSSIRVSALVATLLLFPVITSAKEAAADHPNQLLALRGTVPVAAAGPYVEVGTFQIQVILKLGQPTAKLADGTWLYRGFSVENSNAAGTLVVHFNKGRVSGLNLVTPAVAMALSAPRKSEENLRFAAGE